jgi:uncharacterized protein YndB with AHSA1/START domain
MKERSVIHSTFVIERSYPTTPQRVFAAFSDPAKKRRWFAGDKDFQAEEFEMDFRVGGSERSSFRAQGVTCTNDTVYRDIVPDRRIVIAYTMTLGDRRISSSHATVELLPTEQATDLIFTEQAAFFEGADGPQLREEGWRKLLENLAKELARSLPVERGV